MHHRQADTTQATAKPMASTNLAVQKQREATIKTIIRKQLAVKKKQQQLSED